MARSAGGKHPVYTRIMYLIHVSTMAAKSPATLRSAKDFGKYARQDPNLWPSESESEALLIGTDCAMTGSCGMLAG